MFGPTALTGLRMCRPNGSGVYWPDWNARLSVSNARNAWKPAAGMPQSPCMSSSTTTVSPGA